MSAGAGGGTLRGIGVGPGDPELLTLKAVRLIRAAPVIAYPAPESGQALARAIAAPHLPGGQREIPIRMPMLAERFPAQDAYDRAGAAIAAELDAGNDVAVLCEGDPLLYGSFQFLFARLAGRYRTQIVPGISALTACAAAAGHPLCARDDALTVLPATLAEERLTALLAATEAAAVVKIGRHLPKLRRALAGLGLLDRAIYVAHASRETQEVKPFAAVGGEICPYFAMVLVHARGHGAVLPEGWR